MEIINLTPHELNIYSEGRVLAATVPPSGTVARVAVNRVRVGVGPHAVPLFKALYGTVEGLPAPAEGTIYVVSGLVRSALGEERLDVWQPGELLRNEAGQPVGCVGLQQ